MPEAGYLPIPRKLAAQAWYGAYPMTHERHGAFGTIVPACDAGGGAIGGPLAWVQTGRHGHRLSVHERRIEWLVSDES